MNKNGKGRGVVIQTLIAMPILTVLLSLAAAAMIRSELLPESTLQISACAVAAIVSFLLCLYCALRMSQKKFIWGMLIAAIYCCMMLLGNLLFFGVGYGNILSVVLTIITAGILGSLLGAAKPRKYA